MEDRTDIYSITFTSTQISFLSGLLVKTICQGGTVTDMGFFIKLYKICEDILTEKQVDKETRKREYYPFLNDSLKI